jgi:hypothetical protein
MSWDMSGQDVYEEDEEVEGGRREERIVRMDVRSAGRWCVGIREGGSNCRVCVMRKGVDNCRRKSILESSVERKKVGVIARTGVSGGNREDFEMMVLYIV